MDEDVGILNRVWNVSTGREVWRFAAFSSSSWRPCAGLGRSVCLALPLTEGRNAAWATSPAGNALLAEALRQSLRDETDPRFTGQARKDRGACTLRLEARDGEAPLNFLKLQACASTADPADPVEPIALRQVAPGRYEAKIDG